VPQVAKKKKPMVNLFEDLFALVLLKDPHTNGQQDQQADYGSHASDKVKARARQPLGLPANSGSNSGQGRFDAKD
jgi:hypothetical protein